MMKKRKGSVVDILPSMIMVIAAVILITVFFGLYQILSLNEDVKQISRKYMLTMETMGYLDAASRTSLMQDLSDLQVTDIDLTGSTMTDAGYGNAVYLQITCKLPIEQLNMDGNDMLRFFFEDGTIPIRVRRMSTAKINHDKMDNQKRQGELATFTMVYVLLFLVATVAFALQIREYISLKTHTEDTLAASNLASAVIDIQEYGINHNLVIKDPEQAYSIYQEALKINMGLNDQWEDPTGLISSPVLVEQYIVYNVRGSEVEVTSFGEGLNYSATETLGSATSPNGQVIESTSVYSRISYQVDGYFGVTVPAEKDKLVDIVKNN